MLRLQNRLTSCRGACRALVFAAVLALAGCNSTSGIDTTLGTVAPVQQQSLLPPPAVPEGTQPAPVAADTASQTTSTGEATPQQAVTDDDLVPNVVLRNTGTYPNINDEREPSLQQFTPQEQERLSAYMAQLRAQHDGGTISTAQYQQQLAFLQNLARTHSRDALRQIGAL
ncbi:MAG: hypothetical protein AAFR71_07580 [Pseudomonadota bacterium]